MIWWQVLSTCIPSAPLIPIPMSASCSMPTSLAPSPIPKVTLPVFVFTNLVTWMMFVFCLWSTGFGSMRINKARIKKKLLTRAFCLGEERQHMTDAHPIANCKKRFLRSSSRAYVSDFPSMIRANESEFDELRSLFPSFIWRVMLSFDVFSRNSRKMLDWWWRKTFLLRLSSENSGEQLQNEEN